MHPFTFKKTVARLVAPTVFTMEKDTITRSLAQKIGTWAGVAGVVGVLMATAAQGAIVYTGNSGEVYQFSAPTLAAIGTLAGGYGGSKDLAADTTGIYMTDAGIVWKFNTGGALLSTSFGSTFKTVATNADGNVYVANDGEIGRFTSGLSGWTSLTAASGVTDLAVSNSWIYATNGSFIRRYTLAGSAINDSFLSSFSSVAVGPDGYVYATEGSLICRFNTDLSGFTTLVSPAGGITDLAVASDGIYAVTGGTVYRFNLTGGWAGSNSSFSGGGFDTVATVVVPEPAAAALLLFSGLGLLARRRSRDIVAP